MVVVPRHHDDGAKAFLHIAHLEAVDGAAIDHWAHEALLHLGGAVQAAQVECGVEDPPGVEQAIVVQPAHGVVTVFQHEAEQAGVFDGIELDHVVQKP